MSEENIEQEVRPQGTLRSDVLQNVITQAVTKTYKKKKLPRRFLVGVNEKTQETIGVDFITAIEPFVTKSITKALAERTSLRDEHRTQWGWLTVNVDLGNDVIDVDLLDGVGTSTPIHLDWLGQEHATVQTIVVPEPKRSWWRRLFNK